MMTSSTPGNLSESDTYPANYQPHAAYLQARLTARRHSLTPGHRTSAAGGSNSSSSSGQSATLDTPTPSKSTKIIRRGSLQPTSTAALAAAAAAGGGLTPRRRTGSIDTANAVRWSNDVDSKKSTVDNSAASATLQQQQQQPSADASELIEGFVKQVDEAAITGNRRPLPKPSGAFAAALGVSE